MSAFAPLGGDLPHHPENSHEPNYNTVNANVFPPDPLLQPGSYIETPPYLIPEQPFRRRELIINERNIHGPLMDGVLNSVDGLTESAVVESTPSSRRRSRAGKGLAGAPSWLPDGWQVLTKVRANGATAGLTDKYYVDPLSGFRFRSKKEVEYYLQTGTKRKKASVTDSDGNVSEARRQSRTSQAEEVSQHKEGEFRGPEF
ncbi:methyl-CpG-binding domain-containing protein 6-like isoform X4 [Diospyros lotus]|uniref:methyl-CpG-binding domain-containing protein 6-like isoform X4 n=1 Tax=Diospyros lotus TaxID=55363 RepID=UPI00224CB0BE|nr:methyl-CpG-binding domain-containing protein 6-like isoform X4 [Diospyros lotus]